MLSHSCCWLFGQILLTVVLLILGKHMKRLKRGYHSPCVQREDTDHLSKKMELSSPEDARAGTSVWCAMRPYCLTRLNFVVVGSCHARMQEATIMHDFVASSCFEDFVMLFCIWTFDYPNTQCEQIARISKFGEIIKHRTTESSMSNVPACCFKSMNMQCIKQNYRSGII